MQTICPECAGRLGFHEPACAWQATIAPRLYRVMNLLADYHDVNKLREAQDALSELIAWVSAEG